MSAAALLKSRCPQDPEIGVFVPQLRVTFVSSQLEKVEWPDAESSLNCQVPIPDEPEGPVGPVGPVAPCGPVGPVAPVEPRAPVSPCGPTVPKVTSKIAIFWS